MFVALRGNGSGCLEKSGRSFIPTFFCGFHAREAIEKLELAGDAVSSCVHIIEGFYT